MEDERPILQYGFYFLCCCLACYYYAAIAKDYSTYKLWAWRLYGLALASWLYRADYYYWMLLFGTLSQDQAEWESGVNFIIISVTVRPPWMDLVAQRCYQRSFWLLCKLGFLRSQPDHRGYCLSLGRHQVPPRKMGVCFEHNVRLGMDNGHCVYGPCRISTMDSIGLWRLWRRTRLDYSMRWLCIIYTYHPRSNNGFRLRLDVQQFPPIKSTTYGTNLIHKNTTVCPLNIFATTKSCEQIMNPHSTKQRNRRSSGD